MNWPNYIHILISNIIYYIWCMINYRFINSNFRMVIKTEIKSNREYWKKKKEFIVNYQSAIVLSQIYIKYIYFIMATTTTKQVHIIMYFMSNDCHCLSWKDVVENRCNTLYSNILLYIEAIIVNHLSNSTFFVHSTSKIDNKFNRDNMEQIHFST